MTPAERWAAALGALGLEDPGAAVLGELERRYAEPHRRYHDLGHVLDCLGHLDAHPLPGTDAVALELALWFHDAVYSPLRNDNEEASAELAAARLGGLGATAGSIALVRDLILVTTHATEPASLDEALMTDVDLAILGSERPRFEAYEAALRGEYRWVPGPLYRRRRKALLRSFLERPAIYRTEPFARTREAPARANLAWALSRL